MATKCGCLFDCPDGAINNTCLLDSGGWCYTFVERVTNPVTARDFNEVRRGCFPPTEGSVLQCHGDLIDHEVPKTIACCRDADYCNLNLNPSSPALEEEIIYDYPWEGYSQQTLTILIMAILSIMLVSLFIIAILIFKRCKSKFTKKLLGSEESIVACKQTQQDYGKHVEYASPWSPTKLQVLSRFDSIVPLLSGGSHKTVYNCHSDSSGFASLGSSNSSCNSSYPSAKDSYFHASQSFHTSSNAHLLARANHYASLSSSNSHTGSSMASENTQQTTLSSSRLTSFSSSLPPVSESSATSGSGSGVPKLVNKTLARCIEIQEWLGSGHFGQVGRGMLRGDQVAFKIYLSKDEAFWKREELFYTRVNLSQKNILRFVGADVISLNGCTQLWLVTEYHPLGSLHDFLKNQPINNFCQMLNIIQSIVFGVSFLHSEIRGDRGKPSIAHRNIKSQNIFMKSIDFCCIGDFSLAIAEPQPDKPIDEIHSIIMVPEDCRASSKRYMAPEILNETFNSGLFAAYQAADVYALALVLWEIVNRLQVDGCTSEYAMPYQQHVPSDPSFEEMRTVVYESKVRPRFSPNLFTGCAYSMIIHSLASMITESWSESPSSRPTCMRMKKIVLRCIGHFKTCHPESPKLF